MSEASRVSVDALERFARALLERGGVASGEAQVVAEVAAWCDLVGRDTQGVVRLPAFLKQLSRGAVVSPCDPRLERTGPATARLDGGAGLGYFVASRACDAVAELAGEAGVGVLAVRRSNHLGAAAAWAARLAAAGHVSLVFSNSYPKVAPPGGAGALLGTNPLAFGAPGPDGRAVLVDFATAASAGGAVRAAERAGAPVDPGIFADAGAGVLRSDGVKGFGLALAVEVLAGVLTGAGVSGGVGSMFAPGAEPADVGHLFVAVDPARFVGADAFVERLSRLLEATRSNPARGDGPPPRVPGDARWATRDRNLREGIPVAPATRRDLQAAAARFDLEVPW